MAEHENDTPAVKYRRALESYLADFLFVVKVHDLTSGPQPQLAFNTSVELARMLGAQLIEDDPTTRPDVQNLADQFQLYFATAGAKQQ